MEITDRQKRVLEKIYRYIIDNSYPPTIRELACELGFSSPKAVSDHLDSLKKKGYIERKPSARSIRLTGKTMDLLGYGGKGRAIYLPLIGRIAAGSPVPALENIEQYVPFPPDLIGREKADFALRVKGDSMIGDHILDGDIIAVRSQVNAGNGDIVVALIEDEAVVKRFYRTEKGFELRSSNPSYRPIKITRELTIQGRVVAVQRGI
ncbi:MAG: transcriptional repressor LexA [Actinobacteria bacterium]|nr:transcriptional repressor LexA [Actinomycetota bacterium]